MRHATALVLALTATAAFAAPPSPTDAGPAKQAPTAPARLSVAVLVPVADAKVPVGINLAMQERASAALMASGKYDVVHARQVQSMARRHRIAMNKLADPEVALSAAERLGVQVFVSSTLKQSKGGYTLEVAVTRRRDLKTNNTSVSLGSGEAKAVADGGKHLAAEVLKLDGSTEPIAGEPQPFTANDSAMKSYGVCLERSLEQPVGIENPAVLNEADLKKATIACEAAVKADPELAAAWATLAFVSAVAGNDDRAVAALAKVKPDAGHLPAMMTARFWLVSRYQSSDAAAKVLTEAIAKEPGFLLARVYLAELYNALNRHDEAAKVWLEYVAHSETNPFITSRLAYTLARLGKTAEASQFAERAIAIDPESSELMLEYASRLLDDGKVDQAINVLEPLAAKRDATPELLLRLGYAKAKKGDFDSADKLAKSAAASAKSAPEWRIRARAKLNLATTALLRGNKPSAKGLVTDAIKEGLRPTAVPAELLALLSESEVKAAEAKGLGKVRAQKEISVLPASGGESDQRATPPKGFDEVKVQ